MKEVIVNKTLSVVELDSIKFGEKCYGILNVEHNERGWIQPVEYKSYTVSFRSVYEGVSRGNEWRSYRGEALESIKDWIKSGNKVYEFDNEKELFAWLSE